MCWLIASTSGITSRQLVGCDWRQVVFRPRADGAIGHNAKAAIRFEQAQLAYAGGRNRAEVDLFTSMFLGDRDEYVFRTGNNLLRAWSTRHEALGKRWLELPGDAFWILITSSQ